MKQSLLLFVFYLLFSCSNKPKQSEINKINGYWEIENVVLSDGSKKDYSINEYFDYFFIKDNSGFRKKVKPQLDGTFIVNDVSEKVIVKEVKGDFYLFYSTNYNKWKERLSYISDDELILINEAKDEFHYKRAQPINILK